MSAVAGATGAILGLLVIVEAASRILSLAPETARKLAHVGAALIVAALPLVMPLDAIAVVAAIFIPLLLVSRRLRLLPSIHTAERTTLGEMWFPIGVLLPALVIRDPGAFSFGILVMGCADAAAALVGGRLGRHRYHLITGSKSLEGSAAFLLVSVLLGIATLAGGGEGIALAAMASLAAAAPLVLIEASLGWGLDNAALPLAGAALVLLLT